MGNVSASTFGFQPGANYWQGRWSNGPVWAEQFASGLGLSLTRSTAGGNNWAYGGATTANSTFGAPLNFPNMGRQVANYLATSPTIANDRLFVLWAGGNDYLNGATNPTGPIANISASVTALHAAGARKFLVVGLPLLGNVPRNAGTGNQGPANMISAAHNQLLSAQLSSLRGTLGGSTIYEFQIASLFSSVQANPSAFGITNATQSFLASGQPLANANSYLFYDDIHPTQRGHQILAQAALQVVPEPATMTALGLGVLALMRRRQKRA